jgi:K+-sensing histidine kinase KdpD
VSQALSNLITNAVQYKAKDSAIDVTLGGNGHEVLLAVRNWDPSFRRIKLTRILDPLYRIDVESAATAGRNMGLGLYIADRIAAAHGGRLDRGVILRRRHKVYDSVAQAQCTSLALR